VGRTAEEDNGRNDTCTKADATTSRRQRVFKTDGRIHVRLHEEVGNFEEALKRSDEYFAGKDDACTHSNGHTRQAFRQHGFQKGYTGRTFCATTCSLEVGCDAMVEVDESSEARETRVGRASPRRPIRHG
jgi:hypothetical protein